MNEINFKTAFGMLLISVGVSVPCVVFSRTFMEASDSKPRTSFSHQAEPNSRLVELDQGPPPSTFQRDVAVSQPPQVYETRMDHLPSDFTDLLSPDIRETIAAQEQQLDTDQAQANAITVLPQNQKKGSEHSYSPLTSYLPSSRQKVESQEAIQSVHENIASNSERSIVRQANLNSRLESNSTLQQQSSAPQRQYIRNRFVQSAKQQNKNQPVEQANFERGVVQNETQQTSKPVQLVNYESRTDQQQQRIQGPEIASRQLQEGSAYTPSVEMTDPSSSTGEGMSIAGGAMRRVGVQATSQMAARQPVLPRLQVLPQVEAKAREHIAYGESLARRNSYLASREEFTLALLLIAKSHKSPSNPDAYLDRLAQGLTALDEAADFTGPMQGNSRGGVLQLKVRAHKTKLIAPERIETISKTAALDFYCGFAQSQIEQAIGYSAAGSAALHALGKLETKGSGTDRLGDWTGQARALVFFRAAMSCNPSNSVCSNDLGVLLYEMGRLKEAEIALKRSLASSPTRLGWSNLAAVHNQLATNALSAEQRAGQLQLAQFATREADRFAATASSSNATSVQWASMDQFHNSAAFPNAAMHPVTENQSQAPGQKKASRSASLFQRIKGWK